MSVFVKNKLLTTTDLATSDGILQLGVKIDALHTMIQNANYQQSLYQTLTIQMATPADIINSGDASPFAESALYGSVHSLYGACTVASDKDVSVVVEYSPDAVEWYPSNNIITIPALTGAGPVSLDFWASARFVRLRYNYDPVAMTKPSLALYLSVRS